MEPQYWLRQKDQVTGPYSKIQLKGIIEIEKLNLECEISKDRNKWIKISELKTKRKLQNNKNNTSNHNKYIYQLEVRHSIQENGQSAWENAKLVIDLSSFEHEVILTANKLEQPINISFNQFSTQLKQNTLFVKCNNTKEKFFFTDKVIKEYFKICDIWRTKEYDVKFNIQYLVSNSPNELWEQAILYINCIGPNNWQLIFVYGNLNHIFILSMEQLVKEAQILKNILSINPENQEIRFLIDKKGIDAIYDRVCCWKIELAKRPKLKLCPNCGKEGYEYRACPSCGYKQFGWLAIRLYKSIVSISAAIVGIFTIILGIRFIFEGEDTWILGMLIIMLGLYLISYSLKVIIKVLDS